MKLNKSIADIEEILSQKKALKDYIDETGELFVFSGTLLSFLIAPNPVSAIAAFGLGTDIMAFKFSKLLGWLPNKLNYWGKCKEEIVVERYEKAALVNMLIFHVAIRIGVKNVIPPHLESYKKHVEFILEQSLSSNIGESNARLIEEGERIDKKIRQMVLKFTDDYKFCRYSYIKKICNPLIDELIRVADLYRVRKEAYSTDLDVEKVIDGEMLLNQIISEIDINYNSFLIHFSSEFPEFSTWIDLSKKNEILKSQKNILDNYQKNNDYLKELQEKVGEGFIEIQRIFVEKIESTLVEVQKLRDYSYEKSFGFENILEEQAFISRKIDDITNLYKEEKFANIKAHHSRIKRKLRDKIVDNEDIKGIVYPKNKEIFIPQSFNTIIYKRSKHVKKFLLNEFWETDESVKGENIGKFIMNELRSPLNSFKPIIILGNPGAGKSMLSNILSAQLCDSTDYVPFFIRLRDIVLSDTSPKNHINEGIQNSLEGNIDVDWISWAKEFNTRIPVIFLDGFDELLRASQAEINNYISKIGELLINVYEDYGVSARIVLTSRLSVMQDVEIPNGTTIIRLNPFDEKRQKQWIEQWNEFQEKENFIDFKIPENVSIKELAQEPLLLFMLAVYDFENTELQNDVLQEDFN